MARVIHLIVAFAIAVVTAMSVQPASVSAEPIPPTEEAAMALMEVRAVPGAATPVLRRIAFNGWLVLAPDGADIWIPGLTCVDVAYGALQDRRSVTVIENHEQHERVEISDWTPWWGFQVSIYWGACPRQGQAAPPQQVQQPAPRPTPPIVAAPPPVVTSGGVPVICPLGRNFFTGRFPGTLEQQWSLVPPNGAQFNGQPLTFDVPSDLIVDFGSHRFHGSGRVANASSFTVYSTACEP